MKEYQGPLGPDHIEILGMWRAGGDAKADIVCGEFKAPPALEIYRDRLRFIENLPGKWVQVEAGELVVGDPTTMSIVNATQTVFEKMWGDACKPYRPKRFLGLL